MTLDMHGRISARETHVIPAGLALTLVAAAVLVTTGIGVRGFWVDEMITLHSARLDWGELVAERRRRGHPPLYFALVKLWLDATGRLSDVWLRLPSAAMWALAVCALPRRAALIALTVAALGGVGINHACFARMYAMVCLISV